MKYNNLLVTTFCLISACTGLEELKQNDTDTQYAQNFVERIIFETPEIQSLGEDGEATRASLSQNGNEAIRFGWEETDTVGIYPDQGSQVFFSMAEGVGTNSASFDGGGWALRQQANYSCYYPFSGDIYLKRNAIPVSFVNQEQTGVSNYSGVRFYLASAGTSSSSGTLRFSFQMLNTVIRIKAIGLPAGSYSKLTLSVDEPLFIQEGTYGLDNMIIEGKSFSNMLQVSLKDFTLEEDSTEENPALIYLTSAPINLSGKTITIRIYPSDGGIFECKKTPSNAYESGSWAGLKCTMKNYHEDIIEFSDENVKTACVEKYDIDGDGELSYGEAAEIRSIDGLFDNYRFIKTFDEFQFFTSVEVIPSRCFARMTLLKSITLPESLIRIDDYAFTGCTSLSSFILTNNVTSIGTRAFEGCTSLKDFIFAEGSKLNELDGFSSADIDGRINNGYCGLFGFCTSLESITIPASVSLIGNGLFSGCSSLRTVSFESGSKLRTITGSNSNTNLGAFYNCKSLERVELPESVIIIGGGAFKYCSSLAIINNFENIQAIGDDAFSGCSSLQGSICLTNCKSIGSYAFSGCRSISSVVLSDNCTIVGGGAFSNCENMVSIVLSAAQTNIAASTFAGCISLRDIEIPEYLTAIGVNAFYGCSSLQEINIPEGFNSVGAGAFAETGITEIVLPDGCSTIPSSLFKGCTGLTNVVIPQGVKEVGDNAFSGCTGIVTLTLSDGVTSLGKQCFQRCTSLTNVVIPQGVKEIGDNAFGGCTGIATLTISNGVTSLGKQCFQLCTGLSYIILPASIESIGEEAFSYDSNLRSVKCESVLPPIGGPRMFYNTDCQIFVPAGSEDAYKSAQYWSVYEQRIFGDQGGEVPDIPGGEE